MGSATFVVLYKKQSNPGAPPVRFITRFVPDCVTQLIFGTVWGITASEPLRSSWFVHINPVGRMGSDTKLKAPA